MRSPRLVSVLWADAYSQSTWLFNAEVDKEFLDGGWSCETVSWLIRDRSDGIVLAARRSVTNGSYGLLQWIPRGMVKKVRTIR